MRMSCTVSDPARQPLPGMASPPEPGTSPSWRPYRHHLHPEAFPDTPLALLNKTKLGLLTLGASGSRSPLRGSIPFTEVKDS